MLLFFKGYYTIILILSDKRDFVKVIKKRYSTTYYSVIILNAYIIAEILPKKRCFFVIAPQYKKIKQAYFFMHSVCTIFVPIV